MKCATHPDRDATGFCRTCGKPLCADCTRDVRGVLYCEPCLAAMVAGTPPSPPVSAPSPGVAAALGFIPGLGAVYNAEYVKALIHAAIFAGFVAMLSNGPSGGFAAFLGIGLACFYFYMPIEAYRTARMKQAEAYAAAGYSPHFVPSPAPPHAAAASSGVSSATSAGFAPQAAPSPGASPASPQSGGPPFAGPPPSHSAATFATTPPAGGRAVPEWCDPCGPRPLTGAIVLIAIGVLFLLGNLGLLSGEWLSEWWPLILIGLGVWLFWRRFQQPARKGGSQT